jgi:hypothetical protein
LNVEKSKKEYRDRLVTLSLVSVLLILLYGPAAEMFVAVDRILYDQVAAHVRNEPLSDALIISMNPAKRSGSEVSDTYGQIIEQLKSLNARRIVMAEPPEPGASDELPGWATTLASGVPVFVPSNSRFADLAERSGVFNLNPDRDGVLRSSTMWNLQGGIMTPSLPLAIALHDPAFSPDPRISSSDVSIFLTNYAPVSRITASQFLAGEIDPATIDDLTVFVDTSPALVGSAATLPSGQFVTRSEIVARHQHR